MVLESEESQAFLTFPAEWKVLRRVLSLGGMPTLGLEGKKIQPLTSGVWSASEGGTQAVVLLEFSGFGVGGRALRKPERVAVVYCESLEHRTRTVVFQSPTHAGDSMKVVPGSEPGQANGH